MNLADRLRKIKEEIPEKVKLIAISKTENVNTIKQVYDCNHKIFGENKAIDVYDKYIILPKDIEWHFVGHLQTNKVKNISTFVNLIHSVDSLKLLVEINKEAKKKNRIIDCLLEFHIAIEESKYGLSLNDAEGLLNSEMFNILENIRITGVMGMATFTEDKQQIRKEFVNLRKYFDLIKGKYFAEMDYFREISMGMSSDYKIAIEEGSTMVRIGTAIFKP
ncbi:MAG: YggS family pyridoxal phosphate-dependent enzyme [Bacteroidales bacterium]|nr:YggS family pyridoxal phosphate-dependent enzyme [Bacteroidales bacterium]